MGRRCNEFLLTFHGVFHRFYCLSNQKAAEKIHEHQYTQPNNRIQTAAVFQCLQKRSPGIKQYQVKHHCLAVVNGTMDCVIPILLIPGNGIDCAAFAIGAVLSSFLLHGKNSIRFLRPFNQNFQWCRKTLRAGLCRGAVKQAHHGIRFGINRKIQSPAAELFKNTVRQVISVLNFRTANLRHCIASHDQHSSGEDQHGTGEKQYHQLFPQLFNHGVSSKRYPAP